MVNITGAVRPGWACPAITAMFFLVHGRFALIPSILVTAGVLPGLVPDRSVIGVGTGLMMLALTMTFAYVFAAQTPHQRTGVHEQAHEDPLTLRRPVDPRERDGETASLTVFDLAHCKRVNDEYGHKVGDERLVEVVNSVNARLR